MKVSVGDLCHNQQKYLREVFIKEENLYNRAIVHIEYHLLIYLVFHESSGVFKKTLKSINYIRKSSEYKELLKKGW